MTEPTCDAPVGLSRLVEYWLDELDEAAEAGVDEHLLGCGACSEELARLVALGGGIRAAFARGMVRAFVTETFVRHLAERGVRLREYRVPRNGSVNCSVAPEDEVLITRLEAPLSGVSRLDAVFYDLSGARAEVLEDIPFDPASGEVVMAPKIASIRAMPSYRRRVQLVAVDAGGERVIGDYTFSHTANGS